MTLTFTMPRLFSSRIKSIMYTNKMIVKLMRIGPLVLPAMGSGECGVNVRETGEGGRGGRGCTLSQVSRKIRKNEQDGNDSVTVYLRR